MCLTYVKHKLKYTTYFTHVKYVIMLNTCAHLCVKYMCSFYMRTFFLCTVFDLVPSGMVQLFSIVFQSKSEVPYFK